MKDGWKKGFTLVEISVVLLIVALTVGGIFIGRDIYISARDRNIIKEIEAYKQGFGQFRLKYDQLPGDLRNPGTYWLANTPPLLAGNGNSVILWRTEGPSAWKEMELSGFISSGPFNITGCAASCIAQPTVNIPASTSLPNAGWTVGVFRGTNINVLFFGGFDGNSIATLPAISALETRYIDEKMDDGLPDSGTVRARNQTGYADCFTPGGQYSNSSNQICSFSAELGI